MELPDLARPSRTVLERWAWVDSGFVLEERSFLSLDEVIVSSLVFFHNGITFAITGHERNQVGRSALQSCEPPPWSANHCDCVCASVISPRQAGFCWRDPLEYSPLAVLLLRLRNPSQLL